TTIDRPRGFRPGPKPDINEALTFTSSDAATLRVWGSLNVENRDIAGLEAFLREGRDADARITYRAVRANRLVLSGVRGDNVFYQCYLLSHRGEVINAFDITYPTALRAKY